MKRVYYMENGRKVYVSSGSALVFPEATARELVKRMAKRGKVCLIENE